MTFDITVVIPTCNRAEVLAKTLDCIEKQTASIAYEVIIVNDGSPESIDNLNLGQMKRKTWRLIQNPVNLGRAATRNRGIKEATGTYILMLDDDIWAVPDLLQVHYDKQREIGGGVVVGAVPPAKEIDNTVWNRYIAKRYKEIHNRLSAKDLDFSLFFTGNVSVPLNILRKQGGFNEDFKEYSFEDSELGYRLHLQGIRFVHAPAAIGYHCFSEDLNKLCSKGYEAGRSLHLFVKLHPELYSKMQVHSISLLSWKNIDIIKNIAKLFMFNPVSMTLLKLLIGIMGNRNQDAIVFFLLPWLELIYRAKGYKDNRFITIK